jgi:hypothetical protein
VISITLRAAAYERMPDNGIVIDVTGEGRTLRHSASWASWCKALTRRPYREISQFDLDQCGRAYRLLLKD